MKIQKSQLKSIIKECLIEILSEGLGNTNFQSAQKITTESRQKRPEVINNRRILPPQTQMLRNNEAVKIASGGNPILEAMLRDTQETTYQQQREDANRTDFAPDVGGNHFIDPSATEQLFGEEAASSWVAILDRVNNK